MSSTTAGTQPGNSQSTLGQIRSVHAKRGTQREYETTIILAPSINKPEIIALVKQMQKMFGEQGSRLVRIDSWGMRLLAYPINKFNKGLYLYWRYVGGSDVVAEFERLLRNLDVVLRFYTVKVAEDVDPNARPSEVTEDLLNEVAEPGPDPEELARQAAAVAAARRAASAASANNIDDSDDDSDEEF